MTTDLTGKIPAMQLHNYMSIPNRDMVLNLTGEDVEFMLNTLYRVHSTLIATVKDTSVDQVERKNAYDFAKSTEYLYATIFQQLKLNKPERADLH